LLLWDFSLHDLKQIGGKCFHKKLGAGALHHIPIKRLQIMLTKIALLLGVTIIPGNCRFYSFLTCEEVSYQHLIHPESDRKLWKAHFEPSNPFLNAYQFNVLVAADGENSKIIAETNFDTKTLQFGTAIGNPISNHLS
jgi:hypothetical protein